MRQYEVFAKTVLLRLFGGFTSILFFAGLPLPVVTVSLQLGRSMLEWREIRHWDCRFTLAILYDGMGGCRLALAVVYDGIGDCRLTLAMIYDGT